jgi:hypothetical protein
MCYSTVGQVSLDTETLTFSISLGGPASILCNQAVPMGDAHTSQRVLADSPSNSVTQHFEQQPLPSMWAVRFGLSSHSFISEVLGAPGEMRAWFRACCCECHSQGASTGHT